MAGLNPEIWPTWRIFFLKCPNAKRYEKRDDILLSQITFLYDKCSKRIFISLVRGTSLFFGFHLDFSMVTSKRHTMRTAKIPIFEIHYLLLVCIVKKRHLVRRVHWNRVCGCMILKRGTLFFTPNVRDERYQFLKLVSCMINVPKGSIYHL